MEPRSLFNLILKIIGVFFIRNILEAFSRFLSVLVYLPQYSTESEGYFNLGVTIPPLVLYSLFVWILLFRTESVINALRLDKNLTGLNPNLQFERKTVLATAILVIGGWMLVNEIPEFFRHAVYYLQERRLYRRQIRPDISYLSMSAFKIAIALALIVFNRPIVRVLEAFSGGRNPIKNYLKKRR
jgi:hypothetical protein